jgi:hypothetical protein
MTGKQQRRSVPDRARRRAIRAHAARLGVSYSVAARLLTAQMSQPTSGGHSGLPTGVDEHREWLFAMRERRSFDLRVRDTRLAADLPLGRAAHLAERFPPLRGAQSDSSPRVASHEPRGTDTGPRPLYDGESRQVTLAMLYAVLAYESPAVLPTADELAWVAELGEEAAVDITCAALDRAARLLLDSDRWQLWTRIEAALVAGEASPDRLVRDAATTLGREFRAVILRRSLDGARHTLDAVLVTAHEGHPPGTRVRILTGPEQGQAATIVGVCWSPTGPPTKYQVRTDANITTLEMAVDDVVLLDQPAEPAPALT